MYCYLVLKPMQTSRGSLINAIFHNSIDVEYPVHAAQSVAIFALGIFVLTSPIYSSILLLFQPSSWSLTKLFVLLLAPTFSYIHYFEPRQTMLVAVYN